MGIRQVVQNVLDDTLLARGVLSNHLRRIEATTAKDASGKKVTINQNIYVVYRILTSKGGYGDGKPIITKPYIDINIYYAYDKNDARFEDAEAVIKDVKQAFLSYGQFCLVNDESDIYDLDSPYRGVNIEFKYLGAIVADEVDNGE